jgi:hypothetical protein
MQVICPEPEGIRGLVAVWLLCYLVGWMLACLFGRSVVRSISGGERDTGQKEAVKCKASGSAVFINNHTDTATVSLCRRRGYTHPI